MTAGMNMCRDAAQAMVSSGSLRTLLVTLSCASALAVGLVPARAEACGTRYVAPGGDDTANTCEVDTAPCLTLAHAVAEACAGDTINVAAGTYTLAADVTLDKNLTLAGANAGISPRNGGPGRGPESIINGNAGIFNGATGYDFVLSPGITSLTVEGFTFTNFDGNIFESSLVPVSTVTVRQNIFEDNNGGIFYKFDTSVATEFDVTDNRIATHSMTGVNTALFFLGNVANSHFDDNELSGVASRELVNVYHALTDTTFNRNTLLNTAGLVALFATQSGVEIDGNSLTNITIAGGAAIYVGTNSGHTVSDLDITGNAIETVTGGSGIIVACDTATTASISNVLIEGNTIDTTLYGISIDTIANGTGTITGVTIRDNQFIDNAFSPILAYSRVNPSSGINAVSGLTIEDNTFTMNAAIYGASFFLIDLRNIAGTTAFSGNTFTLSGTLPGGTDAVRALAVRGSRSGTFNITGNHFDGGGVTHNNAPTVFVSGIALLSEDATTGNLPATAVFNITGNVIRNFQDGIVVRDGVAPTAYGNLATGIVANVHNNDLSDNSLFAVRSGAGGEEIDATNNWWGSVKGPTVASNPAGDGAAITVNVAYDPWLLGPPCTLDAQCDDGNGCLPDVCQWGAYCVPAQCASGPNSVTVVGAIMDTTVTGPSGSSIDIVQSAAHDPAPGFTAVGLHVTIAVTPAATAVDPIVVEFLFHRPPLVSAATKDTIQVYKDGTLVPPCTGVPGIASPDPCVTAREDVGDDVRITVLTSTASEWDFLLGPEECGNGVLDAGEACDDGPANGTAASCCRNDCSFEDPGEPCTDGSACTTADVCDGAGVCVGGTPPDCDDLDVCTDDDCDPGSGCVYSFNTEPCDDGNPCTAGDVCGGGTCAGAPGNAGTECRAAAGVCDVAETCTGTDAACPPDGFAPDTTPCTGSSQGDDCDDDAADHCSGTANACIDAFKSAAAECRAATGQCDVAEFCTGTGAVCPPDAFEPDTTPCTGASQGDLCDDDAADRCSGTADTCLDAYQPDTTECRPAVDHCDIEEFCTGTQGECPPDLQKTRHDSVLLLRRGIFQVRIPAGRPSATKRLIVRVRNADILPVPAPGHVIRLIASDGDCPPGTVAGLPDFDTKIPGAQDSAFVAGGRSRAAEIPIAVHRDAFTTHNGRAPTRCTLELTTEPVGVNVCDPWLSNNVFPVEVNVLDRNDAPSAALHETLLYRTNPMTVRIRSGAVGAGRLARVMVRNADTLGLAEGTGHEVTVSAADGDCPPGTVGAFDFGAGAGNSTVVLSTRRARGRLPMSFHRDAFHSANYRSPARCTVWVSAEGPAGNTEPDPSNNLSRLVIDVIDFNDF